MPVWETSLVQLDVLFVVGFGPLCYGFSSEIRHGHLAHLVGWGLLKIAKRLVAATGRTSSAPMTSARKFLA